MGIFLILVLVTVASFILPFIYWPEMLNWPFFINSGWLPYKDIIIIHTPLLPYIIALAFKIFGQSLLTLHLLGTFLLVSSTFIVIKISKSSVTGLLFAFLALAFNSNHVWFESLVTPLLLLAFYFQQRFLLEKKQGLLFCYGAFVVLAILTKQTSFYVLPTLIPFFIRLRKIPVVFISPFILGLIGLILFLVVNNIWPNFLNWAVRFVFFKPFINDNGNSFSLLPNIRQLFLLVGLFSLAFVFLWKDRRFWVVSAVCFMVFSLFFSFPRFDYFHLVPSLAFFSIIIVRDKRLVFLALIIASLVFWKNLNYVHTFVEPEVMEIAETINSNYQNKSFLVLNGPDQLYFLTNRLPADKPWLPQLPWYFAYYSDQKFLEDIKRVSPEIIVFQPYLEKAVDGLGAYRPIGIENFLLKNYVTKEVFSNGSKLLEKI